MDFSRLDAVMDDMLKRGIPGCELAVSYKGETVYRKSVGYADHARTKPSSPDDIYWIYSCSKVITCIAAMRLVESGDIKLDDPVSKYIPEYASLKVKDKKTGEISPATNVMTVQHLFAMMGGMDYNFKAEAIDRAINEEGSNTLSIVRAMAEVPLSFEPGTDFKYSLCHDVLAAVVEVASGMRFSEYLEKNIFDPLGIKDMGFRPDEAQMARMCAQYNYHNGTNVAVPRETSNPYAFSYDYDSGGAGLFSTVDEYMKIITVLANGGATKDGYVLLRPETIEMLGKNLLNDKGLNSFCSGRLYGYGWGLCGRNHIDPTVSFSRASVGEFGWDGAAGAFSMVDAEKNIALYFGVHMFGFVYGYNVIHPLLRNLAIEAIEG